MRYFRYILAALAALTMGPVFAQALPNTALPVWTPAVVGSTYTFNGATATSANAAMLSFQNAANGPVFAQTTHNVPIGGGRTVPAVVKSYPTAANVAGALGRFMGKTMPVLAAGKALYDLAQELGFNVDNSSGALVTTKVDANICTVAPCYDYLTQYTATWYTTKAAACAYIASRFNGGIATTMTGNGCQGTYLNQYGDRVAYNSALTTRSASPAATNQVPSSVTELENAIAAKSGWPSGSAIGRAVADAVASGETIPLPAPASITGPVSVAGSPVSITRSDGTSQTITPVTNITYGPTTVTVSESVTTNNYDSSGASTGSSTATAAPEFETCGLPGSPACKIDEAGTPDALRDDAYSTKADSLTATKQAGIDKMVGAADKGALFTGYQTFFSAPAFVACEPLVLPSFNGASMGSLDACPVVNGVREVMGYIWAITALFLCLGMVRQSVQLG